MDYKFARRMDGVHTSFIRQILKVTEQPDVISFAGGLPAPECFPVAEIAESAQRVLKEGGQQALQYAVTEGFGPLRETLAEEMAARGAACPVAEILVTTGSQQALDLIGRVLLNPGDCVLTESPTYLAAIQAFQLCEARFAAVPMDESGIIVEQMEAIILRERPKFFYSIPNFQNPTGITLGAERRRQVYELAVKHGLLIVEDDPYGKLRYAGADIAPIKALDREGLVFYVSTISKTVTPGLRVGWVAGPEKVLQKMIIVKQGADLHSSNIDQRIADRYLRDFDNNKHVQKIRDLYGARYAYMEACLRELMPEGFRWTHPEGGMFLWVTCPEGIDTAKMVQEAIERKVVFVPGHDFFPDGSGRNFLRLNFSNAPEEKIKAGIGRLAEVARMSEAVKLAK